LTTLTAAAGIAASCATTPTPFACRAGPDGAQPVADRGIGGTGAQAAPPRTADRGIGGTGIVGVVTGFGSICVNGLEVALDDRSRIDIDSTPASAGALRAGQVVALHAADDPELSAESVSVRHAVIGPVQSVSDDALTVAGQVVVTRSVTWPHPAPLKPGDWVAVSGLPRPDGRISGTRIDPAPPGPLLVRGPAQRDGDAMRVGALPIPASSIAAGKFVTVRGAVDGGIMSIASVASDPVANDPVGYFGPATTRFVLQGFVTIGPNGLSLTGGPAVPVAAGVSPVGGVPEVVVLQRFGAGLPQAIGIGPFGAGGIGGLPASNPGSAVGPLQPGGAGLAPSLPSPPGFGLRPPGPGIFPGPGGIHR
jgi:hypothetical protein